MNCNSRKSKVKTKRILCQRCSKSFKSSITLRHHIEVCYNRNSEPKFSCELCRKQFRTQIQYSRHVYYTHAQRTFKCTEKGCGRAFLSNSHLVSHMVTHTTDRPHACPMPNCTYRARTVGRLVQHKIVHGQGRRFSCDYCDYSATTSSNLRRHARIHAGARPYLCPHCPHRTSELDALKKHVLDSGRHPGLPLYVCPWCVCTGFNASSLAWHHLVTEHPNELNPETCTKTGRLFEKAVSERDVSRILGIYCPEVDLIQPPENIVIRQPSVVSRHRLQKSSSQNLVETNDFNNDEQATPKSSNQPKSKIVNEKIDTKSNVVLAYKLVQIGTGALMSYNSVHLKSLISNGICD